MMEPGTGGTQCQATCANQTPVCTSPEIEQCVCKNGYLLSGTTCVLPSECGCIDDDGNYHLVKFRYFSYNHHQFHPWVFLIWFDFIIVIWYCQLGEEWLSLDCSTKICLQRRRQHCKFYWNTLPRPGFLYTCERCAGLCMQRWLHRRWTHL